MTDWQQTRYFPKLEKHQAHIWRANLDLNKREITKLATLLSSEETARANRFRFMEHKRRFIAARGILRQLLGAYLAINPRSVDFSYGEKGKPALSNATEIQFNISHSQEYALLGFIPEHLIGVDLEYQRAMPDALKIAQRFFSPREFKTLQATAPEQQAKLFFQLWTAKEAYLKALGTGLSDSLTGVEIAFDRNQSPYLFSLQQKSPPISDWSLYSCTPIANYSGAFVINQPISAQQITFWHWLPDLLPKQ
ncbi:MAG: 4'-phosphopantetheinyl transferase superfamily protein [Cyanobacteria bacterium P01_C01_bin.72]